MKKLHLICNAHLDPVWQWNSDEGMAAAIATFKSAADIAEEFDYIFCHNESLIYESIENYAPELFERIKKLVAAGKWKIIGGWYLQPDCNMPSGESFVRQIKAGEKYFMEKFGVKPTTACNFDSFGHSIGLVQIMKKCGFDSYLITRPSCSAMDYPGRFFEWEGPDGSKVVVGRLFSYGSSMGHAVKKIKQVLEDAEDVDFVLWGVGNHGGGPSRKDLRDIADLKVEGREIFHSTPENLFKDDIKISGNIKCSLRTSMPGCYTSMMKIKQSHRLCENMLFSAEKIMSIAALAGCKFDYDEMEKAEKKLLLSEFHDILPGSSVPDGEREGLEMLSFASNVFRNNKMKAFLYLSMGEKTAEEGEYPIFVFNPLLYEIETPIEAEFTIQDMQFDDSIETVPHLYFDGKEMGVQKIKENSTLNLDWRKRIIFEGKLKPMALTRFSVKTEIVPKTLKPFSAVSLDSLLSKQDILKDELSLKMYDDTADPWGMSEKELTELGTNPVDFELMSDNEAAEFCRAPGLKAEHVIEEGSVYTGYEKFFKCGSSKGVIEYKFYKNQPFIDVKVTLEFADKNKLVRLCVPVEDGRLIGDGPYVIEEKGDNEVVYQKWIGQKSDSGTTAIINDGIYGGCKKNGNIELTLVRGTGYLFHPIFDRQLYPYDRYLPRIDCGRYVYNFRIMKGTEGEITRMASLFNDKPYAVNVFPIGSGKKETEIKTDKPVEMSVCRYDGNKLVMRFYNPENKEDSFNLTVCGKSTKVTMGKSSIVSVVFKDNKFEIFDDKIVL